MKNISGLILTRNNHRTIRPCLESIKGLVEELIIIDDFSGDDTLQIVKEVFPEAKIIQRQLTRFEEQRNFGLSEATLDWVLMIDSDEIITPSLKSSIEQVIEEPNIDAYWVVRLNRLFDKYLPEKHIHRPILFRSHLRFSHPVHEIIKLEKKKKKKLIGELMHESWEGLEHSIDKTSRYEKLTCRRWLEEKRNYGIILRNFFLLALPVYQFVVCLFAKKYYRLGIERGIMYSALEASSWIRVLNMFRDNLSKK